jgi:hypothetical protein
MTNPESAVSAAVGDDHDDDDDDDDDKDKELTFSADAPTMETDNANDSFSKKKKKKTKKKKKKKKKRKKESFCLTDDDNHDDDDQENDDEEEEEEHEFLIDKHQENSTTTVEEPTVPISSLEHDEIMQQSIPKKTRTASENFARETSDHSRNELDDDSDDSDQNHHGMEVSLNELKRQVMGRDLRKEEDSDQEHDAELQQIRALMNTTVPKDDSSNEIVNPTTHSTTTMADKLRRDLMCSICHEVIYPPVSLLCGHSFCQPCIEWWFDTSKADPNCPTCRKRVLRLPIESHHAISPNFALKSCIMAMYGSEIVQRIQARRPKGERGGAHDKGYQVITNLNEETWHTIKTMTKNISSSSALLLGGTVQIRRNIVLDAEDQRMQLALALYDRPEKIMQNDNNNYNNNSFRVKLCLLTMEEDEAMDSGFPFMVEENSEDEQLMCGRESRFFHTLIVVQMRAEDDSLSPLARISTAGDGCFDYTLDPSTAAGDPTDMRGLLMEHTATGCLLEIDLAQLQARGGGSTLRPRQQPRTNSARLEYDNDQEDDDPEDDNPEDDDQEVDEQSSVDRPRGHNFVVGQSDDSEMEQPDDFEADGFLVNESGNASDVEGEFSENSEEEEEVEDEEEDACHVCQGHGELMICDGGEEDDGCGKAFHASCVGRSEIPVGDWICQDCATSFGIAVGPEGHEFNAKIQPNGFGNAKRKVIIDDDSNDSNDEVVDALDASPLEGQNSIKVGAKKRRMVLLDESDGE